MTPKEKAKELIDKCISIRWDIGPDYAKQFALIAVDLAIEYNDFHIEFLQEVKQEINNL